MYFVMVIDEMQLLKSLHALSENGHRVDALELRLEALIAARRGELTQAAGALAAAQQQEAALSYADGALHTAHQMALIANFGGDLDKLDSYYHETTITLTKMQNRKGVALCMRTVGELAIIKPDSRELGRAWELSERLFSMLGCGSHPSFRHGEHASARRSVASDVNGWSVVRVPPANFLLHLSRRRSLTRG
jgi:hypothetical protein